MPDPHLRIWLHMVEEVPIAINARTVETFLLDAGTLGWELVTVVHNPRGLGYDWYYFRLEEGRGRGGRPKILWPERG